MTRLYLIRHGNTDWVGRVLAGRAPGIALNAEGREQAARLPDRLAGVPIDKIVSSPLERARETAAPLAARLGLEVEVRDGVTEVDYGDWTGRTFAEVGPDPLWRRYDATRSVTRIPGGELALEVQARVVAELERLARETPDGVVAVVSHGDPIKSALAHVVGSPLDLIQRLEISPASVSVVELGDRGPRVLCVNDTGASPRP